MGKVQNEKAFVPERLIDLAEGYFDAAREAVQPLQMADDRAKKAQSAMATATHLLLTTSVGHAVDGEEVRQLVFGVSSGVGMFAAQFPPHLRPRLFSTLREGLDAVEAELKRLGDQ